MLFKTHKRRTQRKTPTHYNTQLAIEIPNAKRSTNFAYNHISSFPLLVKLNYLLSTNA